MIYQILQNNKSNNTKTSHYSFQMAAQCTFDTTIQHPHKERNMPLLPHIPEISRITNHIEFTLLQSMQNINKLNYILKQTNTSHLHTSNKT